MESKSLHNPAALPASRRAQIIVEASGSAKHWLGRAALLVGVSAVLFLFGLGRLPLIGPDEPRYAEVAREMFASGDYISPRLCGCLWFEKPALLYWMAAAAYRGFGVSELSARLPSALAAAITILFLFYALGRASSLRFALLVSLALATFPLFIVYGRAAVPDMLLTASVSVAVLSVYLSATVSGRGRFLYWILGWGAAGASVLAKGLVGIVLFVGILLAYNFIARQPRLIYWKQLAAGFASFLAVISVWYLPIIVIHGREFVKEFFIYHHFRRYLTNEYHHPEPIYFFPVILLAGALPWTPFLIPAVAGLNKWRERHDPSRRRLLSLAWAWLLIPLVFFSFSESKLPGYILPAFPGLAILIGSEVDRVWTGQSSKSLALAIALTAVSALSLGVAFVLIPEGKALLPAGQLPALCYLPLALAAASVALLAAGKRRLFLAGEAAVVGSIIVCAVTMLLPRIDDTLSLKGLSLDAAAQLEPGEKIAFYLDKEYAPVFYAEGRVVCGEGGGDVLNAYGPDELAAAIEERRSLIVITTLPWENDLRNNPRFRTEILGVQGKAAALRVTLRPPVSSSGSARPFQRPFHSGRDRILEECNDGGVVIRRRFLVEAVQSRLFNLDELFLFHRPVVQVACHGPEHT